MEIPGEQRCLISPGTGPDLNDDVLQIIRITGNQRHAQLAFQTFGLSLAFGDHVLEITGHLRIGLDGGQLGSFPGVGQGSPIGDETFDDGLEFRVPAPELYETGLIVEHSLICELLLDLVERRFNLFESGDERLIHPWSPSHSLLQTPP